MHALFENPSPSTFPIDLPLPLDISLYIVVVRKNCQGGGEISCHTLISYKKTHNNGQEIVFGQVFLSFF